VRNLLPGQGKSGCHDGRTVASDVTSSEGMASEVVSSEDMASSDGGATWRAARWASGRGVARPGGSRAAGPNGRADGRGVRIYPDVAPSGVDAPSDKCPVVSVWPVMELRPVELRPVMLCPV
jgi:hypothetical protein